MMRASVIFLFYFAIFVHCRNPVYLENNGYGTVLVAIHESIEEDPLLIERIKEIFTSASSHLHVATKYYTYYDSITILIPKTWSDDLKQAAATTERFDLANFIVDQPSSIHGNNPYTKQFLKCGEPGLYVHLTERWIKDEEYSWAFWGDPGKVIVHEWAHLRWGVYDEYPTQDNEHFYYDENGHVQPTRCSEAVTGQSFDIYSRGKECNTNPSDGVMPSSGCRFIPDLEDNVATGSYMYTSAIESMVTFCHNDAEDSKSRHNRLARNKHNKQCCYQSVWEVMLQHTDFEEGDKPAVDINVMPSFLVVQETELRIVLVLDISGSMDRNDRFELMIQASTKYIGYTVPRGTWIGIVEFDNTASILSYLIQIDDMETRQELIDLLPDGTGSGTSIGSGLEAGIEVLEEGWETPAGGILFLITDGEENTPPFIDDVIDELVEKEIVVDTLALSDEADPGLAELSAETGGTAYWYSESDDSTALHDAFTDTITSRTSSSTDTPVQLTSYKTSIDAGDILSEYIYIDPTIGRHTVFFIFWDFSGNIPVDVVIKAPDGTIIVDGDSGEYYRDDSTHTIIITINGVAQSGQWTYDITNTDTDDQTVEVSIESKSVDSSSYPLRLQSTVGSELITESPPLVVIYAEVLRGYEQVLGANVIATIERPSPFQSIDLTLLDNGAGSDITKDDGVYSAYFIEFVDANCEQACRYGIQVNSDNTDGEAYTKTTSSTGAMPTDYGAIPVEGDPNLIGDFGRVTSGGSFQVDDSVHIPGIGDDPYPPSRISDLESPTSDYDEQTITLHWTAVGDDLDQGTAHYYDLRYSTSFSDILDNFENAIQITNKDLISGDVLSPSPSGSSENVTVWLATSGTGTTYYFGVRAVDEANNKGDVSTIAQNTIVPIPSSGLAGWEIFLICLACITVIAVAVCAILYMYWQHKENTKVGVADKA
ncbi:calcium-activated chloride channel regulator 1-like [Saccoglossus kowalevskii]|uniref:Epithelial chloride channel protein-like n=1 Tax=Saccoglossus kowalevskii TaxID=10224 RepID=A0ABM0GIA5_SACKO|nr:PREDICTED: epithelial chloride channel protein-like [Saccoglossus kowalevskii]